MSIKIEICCGSFADCIAAQAGGADRIELNSALFLGGLTPSLASLKLAKEQIKIPIVCMVRPRGAGFYYSELEYQQMKQEALDLLANGADGIAFGFLNQDRTIDQQRTLEFTQMIHAYGKEAVFHRAFDCVDDMDEAIQTLIKLQIDRVLSSGLKKDAIQGSENLAILQTKYGDKIEILAGCGIRDNNVLKLIAKTQVVQVHTSAKAWINDPTTSNADVSYAYHGNEYEVVSEDIVKEFVAKIKLIA